MFRQLHTDLATILVLESRATAPLPPKAVEDGGSRARGARCLRCVDAHFCYAEAAILRRGSNSRPGVYHPFVTRGVDTRRRSAERSVLVSADARVTLSLCLLLHWYDASDALQRTSACCCSGCDRDREERLLVGETRSTPLEAALDYARMLRDADA